MTPLGLSHVGMWCFSFQFAAAALLTAGRRTSAPTAAGRRRAVGRIPHRSGCVRMTPRLVAECRVRSSRSPPSEIVLNHVGAAEDPLPPNAVRAELSRDPVGPFLGCA